MKDEINFQSNINCNINFSTMKKYTNDIKINSFGIIEYIINKSKEKKTNKIKIFSGEKFIITIDDLLEDHYIHRGILLNILVLYPEIIKEIPVNKQYIKLIEYPNVIRLIFEYILGIKCNCLKLNERPNNLTILTYEENLNEIEEFCKVTGFDYNIYSNMPLKNFKRIILETDKNHDCHINTNNNIIKNTIFAQEYARIKHNLDINSCYCKTYKTKRYINFNKHDYKNVKSRIKNIKKWFRFKWYNLLLPIYIFNNINIDYLFDYIFRITKNLIKVNLTKRDLFDIGLHPIQLIGSTNIILFRRHYNIQDKVINGIFPISFNSVVNWAHYKCNKNIYNIILKNINFDYSYNGKCHLYDELRLPLTHLNKSMLIKLNYPYNPILCNVLYANQSRNTRVEELTKAIFKCDVTDKLDYIDQFIRIID